MLFQPSRIPRCETHLLMATMEVVETSSSDRQSDIITVILHRHIKCRKFREIFPLGAAPLCGWALCRDPMVWIASVELAPSVWRTEILAVILHPHFILILYHKLFPKSNFSYSSRKTQ